MRKALFILITSIVSLAGAVFAVPAQAEGLVDLGATNAGLPATVSPPGAFVIYTSTFSNQGLLAVEGTFKNVTSNGTLVGAEAPGCTVPAAGTANPTVTCTETLAPGTSKQIRVKIQTPLTAPTSVTNTASAAVNPFPVQPADMNATNNSSSVSTPVQAVTVGSAGFVPQGGTMAYKLSVLTVRQANLGVVAYMNDVPAVQSVDCGGVPCAEGLRADFDQDPAFFGLVEIDVSFGKADPCRGLGNPACHPLFFRKGPAAPVNPVQNCGSQGPSDPCLERVYKDGGNGFHFVVVLKTNDPDLLSPTKSLLGGVSG